MSSPRSRAPPRSSLTHRTSDPLEITPGDFEQASPERVPPTLLVDDESKLRDERRDRSLDTLREFHPSSPRVKSGLGDLVRLVIDDVADGRERQKPFSPFERGLRRVEDQSVSLHQPAQARGATVARLREAPSVGSKVASAAAARMCVPAAGLPFIAAKSAGLLHCP